jgi:hypothetical protein
MNVGPQPYTFTNLLDHAHVGPFVHAFYAFESPLFYNHYNREGLS